MKSTPRILIGWQILVPVFGCGTVVGVEKLAGFRKKSTVFRCRWLSTALAHCGSETTLKLALKNPSSGKHSYKTGSLQWTRYPFILVSANGL